MDAPFIEERIAFRSEGLLLEGVLAYPENDEPAIAALVLSPHPHLGGTMDNNVVRALATAAAADGAATLRFNYRGVGASEMRLASGESLFAHWERMERLLTYEEILPDAQAALGALAEAVPSAHITVLGYSLGAVLAGLLAPDERVARIVAVALPVKRVGLGAFAECRKPKVFVADDRDFAFDPDRFAREYADLPEPKTFVPFPGADHFFRKQEQSLYARVKSHILPRP